MVGRHYCPCSLIRKWEVDKFSRGPTAEFGSALGLPDPRDSVLPTNYTFCLWHLSDLGQFTSFQVLLARSSNPEGPAMFCRKVFYIWVCELVASFLSDFAFGSWTTLFTERSSKYFLPTQFGDIVLSSGPAFFSKVKRSPARLPAPALLLWLPDHWGWSCLLFLLFWAKLSISRPCLGPGHRAACPCRHPCVLWAVVFGHLTCFLLKLSFWEEKSEEGWLLKGKNPGDPAVFLVGPWVVIHLLLNWGERGSSESQH